MNLIDNGDNNQIIIDDTVNANQAMITIHGTNNIIFIQENTVFNAKVFIQGNNNQLIIGKNCRINGNIHIRQGSKITINDLSTFVFVNLFSLEGQVISIGKDCMFSSDIIIRNSDEHTILDMKTQNRLNQAQSIYIGDSVWLSEGVYILKGVEIVNNVIVGAKSLVSSNLTESYAIYAGIPAKKIRSGVIWDRQLK